eukprot:9250381-Ditylum_brightwellii.AAC.1
MNLQLQRYTPILQLWLVVLGLEKNYIYPVPFVDINIPTLEFLPPMNTSNDQSDLDLPWHLQVMLL